MLRLECVKPYYRSKRMAVINRCSIMNWEEITKEKSKASSSGLHLLFYYKGSKISRLFNFKKTFILRREEWSQINVLTRIHMNKLEKGNINPKKKEGHNNMS